MTALTDTQSLLLASAAQRESGSLLPPPHNIAAAPSGIAKSLASLLKHGFAEERTTRVMAETHRIENDARCVVFITPAGLVAIGIDDGGANDSEFVARSASTMSATTAPRKTKAGAVLALLQRENGATLIELVEVTGWLPHTTRAALTGLRRKGHVLERYKRDDVTCYRAPSVA